MTNTDQFTRHLRCKGVRVVSTVVPYPWMACDELAGKLYHHNVDTAVYEARWKRSFTAWRLSLRVSCLKTPTHTSPWPSRTNLPKLHVAA